MRESKTVTSETDSSATESDSSATKTDSEMIDDESDAVSSPSPESFPFSVGEKVLAYHGTCVYAAKVTKVELLMREWKFYVHYLGWKKSWDEWVHLDRLMKFTEENVKIQEALNGGIDKNVKLTRTSQNKPKVPRGRKRKNDSIIKDKGVIPMEDLVLQIPLTLKKQLVDDFEFVTHLGKLVKLPCTPNVNDILKNYLDYRSKKDSSKKLQLVEEIMKGLCCYFDKALPAMLLYKIERQQYEKAIENDVSPSSVYGAEHLLRLFVKLPEILLNANIEVETLKGLQPKLVDFLKFIQKNQSAIFLSTYHVPEDIERSTNRPDV